eukprot:m.48269 g.48269  ORF g.48269 m.48269 type:complete len:152 (+) comp11024_c0_seq1:572-1027(+)
MAAEQNDLVRLSGTVVKGFGRGSKELGIPTANFSDNVIETLPESLVGGIHFGWVQIGNGPVYPGVMSIGWNPFYQNEKRSAEVHILNEFEADFYGETMRMVVTGYIRPEKNFDSLDALIKEINNDIDITKQELQKPELAVHKGDSLFAHDE